MSLQGATLTVGLGTRRRPKVLACSRALESLGEKPSTLRILTRSVPSGVRDTPLTTGEMMEGARRRADNVLRELGEEAIRPDYAVGLEGGIKREPDSAASIAFLESWAYVTDGAKGYFGSSGAIELPARLADRVVVDGQELGPAADAEFEETNIASGVGTFGALTRNLVTREDAFVRALLHAFSPFYNASVYSAR